MCERELPLGAFEMNGAFRRWTCRICRRRAERIRGRRRYHRKPEVRRHQLEKARAYYAAHREQVRAGNRQRYWDRKLGLAA